MRCLGVGGANVDEDLHWEAHWHFDESQSSLTENKKQTSSITSDLSDITEH